MTLSPTPNPSGEKRALLKRAANLYRQGDTAGAAKMLGLALEADRSLGSHPNVRKLAAAITRLDEGEAVRLLANAGQRDAFILKRGPRRGAPAPRSGWMLPLLLIGGALLVIGVGLVLFIAGRNVPELISLSRGGQTERRTLASRPDLEYYVAAPLGPIPENGWPTLVAVHHAGQTGADVVSQMGEITQTNGVLLVAPTFADLRESAYVDNRSALLLILEDMQMRAFQQPAASMHFLGQVYFGCGDGAGFVSWLAGQGLDYTDSGYAIEGPLAVSLVNGGPKLFMPVFDVPYLISVGENSSRRNLSADYAERLRGQGFSAALEIIPDAGEELTPRQIELTVELARQVYGE